MFNSEPMPHGSIGTIPQIIVKQIVAGFLDKLGEKIIQNLIFNRMEL
jgi:hypothetical protein